MIKKLICMLLFVALTLSTLTVVAPTAKAGTLPNYVKFEGTEEFSIKIVKKTTSSTSVNLQYSTDGTNWSDYSDADRPEISSGDNKAVYFRGTNDYLGTGSGSYNYFVLNPKNNGTIAVSGNIMALLNYNSPSMSLTKKYSFSYLFKDCTSITSAPFLPATTLAESCYYAMFSGCTGLTSAPVLPATTLANYCYQTMFSGCTGLTSAPVLPAETLSQSCYSNMFKNCTSLEVPPELKATQLAKSCYSNMFYGCSSLAMEETTDASEALWVMPSTSATSWNTSMISSTAGKATSVAAGKMYKVGDAKVLSIKLNKSSTALKTGEEETLSATITPNNAADKSLVWSSNAESVATVDQTGKITAVGVGTATITAKNEASNKSATCKVTVTAAIPTPVKDATYSAFLTLSKNIDVKFVMGNIASEDGDKLSITADGLPVGFDFKDGTATCVLKSVKPNEIGKDISIVVTYDGVEVKNFKYSVKSYCEAVYDHQSYGADSDLGKLCTALLNYGKYAEDYVNGDTASTVNAGHVIDFSKVTVPTSKSDIKANDKYGDEDSVASLALGSIVTLNYIVNTSGFEYSLDPQNFFILNENNQQIDPKKITVSDNGESTYTISIDLYAYQLANQYTLKVKDVALTDFKIAFGVYDYCAEIQDMSVGDTLKTLCKAIYTYGEAVKNYTK